MKTEPPDDDGDRPSAEERKAQTALRLKEFAEIECALFVNRKALRAKGEPVDDMLKELRERRAEYIKANETLDEAEEAEQAAKEARDRDFENIRQIILTGRQQWETEIENASGDEGAQTRVELWEGYQEWKRTTRKQLEEARLEMTRDLVSLLDD